MANYSPNISNLIPANKRSKEEVRKNSRKGGIKSGKVRKQKKLLTELYGKFLEKKFDITINDKKKTLTGQQFVNAVIQGILEKGDSASVAMLKEIRQATEGSDPINSISGENVQINIITNPKQIKGE